MAEADRKNNVFSKKSFSFKVFLGNGFDNPAKNFSLKSKFLFIKNAKM